MTLDKLVEISERIRYKNWEIRITSNHPNGGWFLQVVFDAVDRDPNSDAIKSMQQQRGRKWYMSQYMSEDEVVRTVFKAIMTAEEHEIREEFTYNNKRIFGPHIEIASLCMVCDDIEHRQEITK